MADFERQSNSLDVRVSSVVRDDPIDGERWQRVMLVTLRDRLDRFSKNEFKTRYVERYFLL
jgi:hypothetical protein